MNYYAPITCSIGTPSEIDMSLWRSNANTPTSYQNLQFQIYNCAANPCTTAYYAYNPDRTEHVRNSASYFVTGTDGLLYTFGPTDNVWTYNSAGGGYPNFTPSNSYVPFAVFFPNPSFTVCDDPPHGSPPCPRDNSFRQNVINVYNSNGWSFPSSNPADYQAYHIKPLQFGGSNNVSNGVLLLNSDHLIYMSWWNNFDPSLW